MGWTAAELDELEQVWNGPAAPGNASTSAQTYALFGYRWARRSHAITAAPVVIHCTTKLDQAGRAEFYRWKRDPLANPEITERYSTALIELLRVWFPVVRPSWCVVTPPQGASTVKTRGGIYPAHLLARRVADALGLTVIAALGRTRRKTIHSPYAAMNQDKFIVHQRPADLTLVIDDMVTSGSTMALALQALHAAGVPALAFSYGAYVT